MAGANGRLVAAALCLLAPGTRGISTEHFLSVANLAGKETLSCASVCSGIGGSVTSSSHVSWASGVSWTCGCFGVEQAEVKVECLFDEDGKTYLFCCPQGPGCGPFADDETKPTQHTEDESTSKAEQEVAKDVETVEDTGGEEVTVDDAEASCAPCLGSSTQFSKQEIVAALSTHNRLRKLVGSAALKWNCALMCQAQEHADKCTFGHSESYASPIKAGENLASGTDVKVATWMWFVEYGGVPVGERARKDMKDVGHFTAVVWKETKQLGCGVCREGASKLVTCQYAHSPPNYATSSSSYEDNVPAFDGKAQDWEAGGFDVDAVKALLSDLKSGQIPLGDALERLA